MNEISCKITNNFLTYVMKNRPELLEPLVEGLPYDMDYLMDTDNWISWDTERILEERLARLFDDEFIMFKIGNSAVTLKSVGILNVLFNLFMTPEKWIRFTPKVARYFTKGIVDIKVLEASKESATVDLKINGKQTRGACLYNQGLYSQMKELFGLSNFNIDEIQCCVPIDEIGPLNGKYYHVDDNEVVESNEDGSRNKIIGRLSPSGTFAIDGKLFGADSCIYKLSWKKKMRHFRLGTAGREQALQEALQHLEQNYEKLQSAYEQLWRSEEKYKDLMDNASDIICLIDDQGTIMSINKKGSELSGYSFEEIVGRHFNSFVEESYKEETLARFISSLKGSPTKLELAIITRDGRRLILSVNTSPIREGEKTIGLMLIARDVTEEREMASRLLEAERFAAKGIVAAEIAHEINNSLANIETALFIINEIGVEAHHKQDVLRDVYDEIDRMSGIVKGILEVYRSDDAVIQAVDINTEIMKVLNFTGRRLSGKGISVIPRLYPNLSTIACYPGHIKQILLNLIKNAGDAVVLSSPKLIMVSTEEGEGFVRIKVKDTGCGITEELVKKVSSQLFTTKERGVGLGLSICRQIVEKYGGNLIIESEERKGTTVTISLPINQYAQYSNR
jgi:PAS domain S-box-containing protein